MAGQLLLKCMQGEIYYEKKEIQLPLPNYSARQPHQKHYEVMYIEFAQMLIQKGPGSKQQLDSGMNQSSIC